MGPAFRHGHRNLRQNQRAVDTGIYAIIFVAAVLLFVLFKGPKQLSEWAHHLGRAKGEFDRGKAEVAKELRDTVSSLKNP
jgi:Sec-independent protein translocase protein TatA